MKLKLSLDVPILSGHALVAAQTPLRVVLGGLEELGGLGRVLLHDRGETYLAFQEVLELAPIRLLAIQGERVLALGLQSGVVAPQVPVTEPWLIHGA